MSHNLYELLFDKAFIKVVHTYCNAEMDSKYNTLIPCSVWSSNL